MALFGCEAVAPGAAIVSRWPARQRCRQRLPSGCLEPRPQRARRPCLRASPGPSVPDRHSRTRPRAAATSGFCREIVLRLVDLDVLAKVLAHHFLHMIARGLEHLEPAVFPVADTRQPRRAATAR